MGAAVLFLLPSIVHLRIMQHLPSKVSSELSNLCSRYNTGIYWVAWKFKDESNLVKQLQIFCDSSDLVYDRINNTRP